ncbi:MAG: NADH-quinone oxidoreductase subunit A [Crenarchaeota archaeon]|nr:NADH-quinone oxidoreductase subunit A [Thermoproteota archaeon]
MIEPGAVVFTAVAVAAAVGAVVEAGSLVINKLLEDKTPPHPDKYEAYECGELTIGDPLKVRYTVNFYPYLVAFFVAEVAGILALAAAGKPTPNALVGLALLYFALAVGIVWLRKIGIMRWVG